jgi:histidyl-tRNA synthetase
MAPKPQNVKGMIDHLPASQLLRQQIIATLTGIFERHGFEPMSTPAVEYAETLEGKIGEDEKLIFRVEHSGGGDQRMALRYDQTVPLARVVAQYPNDITLPFRRYAVGPSYRGERPQKGRYREFTQADIDIVGSASPLADAEVIAIIGEALGALGFTGFRTLVNHRELLAGVARGVGLDEAAAGQIYRAVDKLDKIGPDGVRAELLRGEIDESQAEAILELVLIEGAPEEVLTRLEARLGGDARTAAALQNLRQIVGALGAMGVDAGSYALAPRLARGLSYYTGCVFETVIESPKIGSLLGGGRYDELIGQFSGRRIPTVGLAMGVERLAFVMGELGIAPARRTTAEVLVTLFDAATAEASLALAGELRAAAINAEIALDPAQGLGRQFKYADQKGIPLALVLGPDELAQGLVQLKTLASGEQRPVARGAIVAEVRAALGR